MARPRADIDLEVIARRLWEARAPEGGFHAWDSHECASLLETAFPFVEEIPAVVRERLVHKAIFAANRDGTAFTARILNDAIARAQSELLRQPRSKYTLVSTLSVPSLRLVRRVAGCSIRIGARTPRRIDHSPLRARFEELGLSASPRGYSVVTTTVNERDPDMAFHRASWTLDLLRSIWNLMLNRRVGMRVLLGAPPEPVNQIRCGQVHTLHDSSGKPAAGQTFWGEPRFSYFEKSQRLDAKHSAYVMEGEQQVRAALAGHPYREVLESSMVRYCRALDGIDMEGVFLKLWSLLETLTNTATAQANNDDAIRRAAFVFEHPAQERSMLEHLRARRNRLVHHAAEEPGAAADRLVYQLKGYVEALLQFHLGRGRQFVSLGEACELLRLPADPAEVTKRARLLAIAQSFRGMRKANKRK